MHVLRESNKVSKLVSKKTLPKPPEPPQKADVGHRLSLYSSANPEPTSPSTL